MGNLIYVVGALALATLGTLILLYRSRKPASVEAGIEEFSRELAALAPERRSGSLGPARVVVDRPDAAPIRVSGPAPAGAGAPDRAMGPERSAGNGRRDSERPAGEGQSEQAEQSELGVGEGPGG